LAGADARPADGQRGPSPLQPLALSVPLARDGPFDSSQISRWERLRLTSGGRTECAVSDTHIPRQNDYAGPIPQSDLAAVDDYGGTARQIEPGMQHGIAG
jgi:hypothetical protein